MSSVVNEMGTKGPVGVLSFLVKHFVAISPELSKQTNMVH